MQTGRDKVVNERSASFAISSKYIGVTIAGLPTVPFCDDG
jgi:hypothetical protein